MPVPQEASALLEWPLLQTARLKTLQAISPAPILIAASLVQLDTLVPALLKQSVIIQDLLLLTNTV